MQNHSYLWDKVGNLVQRLDGNSPGPTENFYYDNLYRLDYSQRNGATNLDLSYDPSGNILTSTGSDVPVAAAGTISWYSYNLPSAITQGSASSQFFYGPNRARYKQVASGKTTLYLGGLMERVDTGGTIEYRHYVQAPTGLVAVHNRTPAAQSTHYTLRDHLGSVASITSASGTVLAMLSNGAYGKRRDGTWTGDPSAPEWSAIASATDRGFTGHEHLDGVSLIHMNGRVYDPVIGQFASPDPTIPDPLNTQSYNRYSYVNNNPLTFTDPSGFDPARNIEVEPDFEARRDALIYAYAQSVMFNGGHAPSIWDAPTGLDRARMQNPGFTGFGPLIAPSTSSGYWTRVPGGASQVENPDGSVGAFGHSAGSWEYVSCNGPCSMELDFSRDLRFAVHQVSRRPAEASASEPEGQPQTDQSFLCRLPPISFNVEVSGKLAVLLGFWADCRAVSLLMASFSPPQPVGDQGDFRSVRLLELAVESELRRVISPPVCPRRGRS